MVVFQTFEAAPATAASAARVAAIRAILEKRGIDAFLIPRADEHQNEYVPACSERLAYVTGFTGSAGLSVVTRKKAAIFVDGRYTVQAPQEVDARLFEIKGVRTADLKPWLLSVLKPGARIGFDPKLHTISEIDGLASLIKSAKLALVPMARNPVDTVWGAEKPPAPAAPVRVQPLELAGVSIADKISGVQTELRKAKHDALVLSATDSICWLFNIRGGDIPHNPVVLAYAIVPASGKADLFLDTVKITPEVRKHLSGSVRVRSVAELRDALSSWRQSGKTVRLATQTASWWLYRSLGGAKRVARGADPCVEAKAVKTTAEISGARAAHLRDGAAMVRFLAWLDAAVESGNPPIDEIMAVKRLEECRRETNMLLEISFPAISGSGPNGAIVHYRVNENTNRVLQKGELFLVDSGGQYQDGTTDITRTIAIGAPTREMRERFTLVLKGMIAISTARFPSGTRGVDLDPFARRALWNHGLIYDHGTGHGVGSYLNVHEGPASISKGGLAELKPGMILSNEPGYYKAGAYGIRIENLLLVTDPEPVGGDRPMMGFETLTLAPIDRRLVVPSMLSAEERDWLDTYHARVRDRLAAEVEPAARRWLTKATAKIDG